MPREDRALALMMNWQPAEEPLDITRSATDGEAQQVAFRESHKASSRGTTSDSTVSARGKSETKASARSMGDTPRSVRQTSARLYSPPADEPHRAVCLRDRLPLRAELALSSKVVGHLAANQTVDVIQTERLANGTVRARVGKPSSPRGCVVHPLGWATVTTDQEEDLMRMLTADEHHDILWRREVVERRERIDRDRTNFREGSMAARIAQRRMENLVGRKNFQRGLSCSEQVDVLMPRIVAEVRTARGGGRKASNPSQAGAQAAPAPVRVENPYAGPAEAHEAWMNAPMLQRLASEHYQKCRDVELKVFKTLPERLGLLMQVVDVNEDMIADLVRATDSNGDLLNKSEFRQVIRSLGLIIPAGGSPDAQPAASTWLAGEATGTGDAKGARGCADRELDLNFASLDQDKSGSLDATEVSRYLMGLKVAITRKAYEKSFKLVVGLRSAAQAFERASSLVTVLESGEDMKPPERSPAAKLGIFLKGKGVKMSSATDVNAIFKDGDGNGKIIEEEFCEAMTALGYEAPPKELSGLFQEFDNDKNSSLAVKELVACLKTLATTATEQLAAEAVVGNAAAQRKEQAEYEMKEGLRLAFAHFRATA